MNKEHSGIMCPNCEDTMDSNVTCLRPTWSDYYDNVVCLDCAERIEQGRYPEIKMEVTL